MKSTIGLLISLLVLLPSGLRAQGGETAWLNFNLSEESTGPTVKARNLTFEAGGNLGDFGHPGFSLKAWNGESLLRLGLRTNANAALGTASAILVNGLPGVRIKQDDTISYELYRRPDGIEWSIILAQKPSDNRLALPIQTQGLNFYYQPPLTPDEIAEGLIRPDSVVSSFAVYHASRVWDRRIVNISVADTTWELYGTGKAFHIFRPKMHDALGTAAWCELAIKPDSLVITIPQAALSSAVYPVTIDPTFGTASAGASGDNMGLYLRGDGAYMSPSDAGGAALDSIKWFCYSASDNQDNHIIYGLYTDESPDINPNQRVAYQSAGISISGDEDGTWQLHAGFTGTLSASTAYHFAALSDTNSSTVIRIAYDTQSGIERNSTASYQYTQYPNLPTDAAGFTWISNTSRKASVYGAYTVVTGGTVFASRRRAILEEE